MNAGKRELVTVALARAKETLSEVVDVLIQNELWNTAVNRLYYACFHAVTALLASNDIYPKSHSGTNQLLGLHFIKTGIISKKTGEHYTDVFFMRQSADYEYEVEYEKVDVLKLIQPTADLIAQIEEILSKG
jgi:uncharacterized protein (UPF0332 family)